MDKAAFYWRPQVALFFPALEVKTPLGMFVAAVVFALLTLIYEGFKCLRLNVAEMSGDRWNGVACFSKAHIAQTLLFVSEMLFSYIIMLTVMSFNGWLFLAVITGSAMGYHACQLLSRKHRARPLTTNPLAGTGDCQIGAETRTSGRLRRRNKNLQNEGVVPAKDKLSVICGPEEVEQLVTAV